MTHQEKQLLLKDLCARLPYGVKILQGDVVIETLGSICKIGDNDYTINPITTDMYNGFHVEQVKPYLRPMSSMTEEEKEIYSSFAVAYGNSRTIMIPSPIAMDYLLSYHFDVRGLIPRGLALEAPTDMYKTE